MASCQSFPEKCEGTSGADRQLTIISNSPACSVKVAFLKIPENVKYVANYDYLNNSTFTEIQAKTVC